MKTTEKSGFVKEYRSDKEKVGREIKIDYSKLEEIAELV